MKYLINLIFLLLSVTTFAEPKVVVTIKPLYSIAAHLTKGISLPEVLMKEKASPHHFYLLPSHIQTLKSADIVLWVGPEMEIELIKTIEGVDKAKIITSMDLENIKILEIRSSCGKCDHRHHHEHSQGILENIQKKVSGFFGWVTSFFVTPEKQHQHHKKVLDPHIWTNPDNALTIAESLKNKLILLDEKNKQTYEDNYTNFSAKIFALKNKIRNMIKGSNTRFFIFHDSLQYLEDYAGLKSEVVPGDHETGFSLQEIIKLKEMLAKSSKKCILTDEELPAIKISEMLGVIPDLKIKEISPESIYTEVGENTYFEMMDDLIVKINDCIN